MDRVVNGAESERTAVAEESRGVVSDSRKTALGPREASWSDGERVGGVGYAGGGGARPAVSTSTLEKAVATG